jgi:hypothetical protein
VESTKAFHLNAGIKANLFAIKMDFYEPFMTYIQLSRKGRKKMIMCDHERYTCDNKGYDVNLALKIKSSKTELFHQSRYYVASGVGLSLGNHRQI